jgi:hypothetical protein
MSYLATLYWAEILPYFPYFLSPPSSLFTPFTLLCSQVQVLTAVVAGWITIFLEHLHNLNIASLYSIGQSVMEAW